MNEYKFVSKSTTGRIIRGKIKLENTEELKKIMIEHNYQLIKYKILKKRKNFIEIRKVKKQDLLNFIENLYLIIKSGISIKQAIFLCADTTSNRKFKNILIEINKEMEKGRPLSSILSNYENIFPLHFRTMINLAEISGNLKIVLEHLINYYRYEIMFKKKMMGSLFYPILLVAFSIIVVIVVSTIIIPTFVSIFDQMNVTLPLITKIMISISNVFSNYMWLMLIIIVLIIVILMIFRKTEKGKIFIDYLKIKLPFYKKVYILNFTSKFCRCFRILLQSGISTVSSLQTTSHLMNNKYLQENFIFAVDEVKKGRQISKSLFTLNVFPIVLIETIKISEETANFEYSLDVLSMLFEEEEHNYLQKITSIIEPCLIIFIALIVILVVASVFIPLFTMFDNVGGF